MSAKSVPHLARLPQPDPPIYHALLRSWAERGMTLPGRHDPEWVRLAAPPIIFTSPPALDPPVARPVPAAVL